MLFFLSCLHIVGCVDCGFNYAVLFDSGPVVKRSLCECMDSSSFGIRPVCALGGMQRGRFIVEGFRQ